MFGHLQRAITSGSHKLVLLDESLDSIRSDTSFAFAHFVSLASLHSVKDQSRTLLISDERTYARTGFFLKLGIRERQIMASKDNFTLGSQRANHLDRNVEDGARMDRQMLAVSGKNSTVGAAMRAPRKY